MDVCGGKHSPFGCGTNAPGSLSESRVFIREPTEVCSWAVVALGFLFLFFSSLFSCDKINMT